MPPFAYGDVVAPMFATVAVLAALEHRRQTGEGQRIDVSQVEPLMHTVRKVPELAEVFDVVLGFGSHPDPARGLAQALVDAQREARRQGRALALIGHVCGTDGDPQDKAAQVRQLEAAGAVIVGSNVEAAALAAQLAAQIAGRAAARPA